MKDVQFTPDMPDMKIRTWCLETIPFELIALVRVGGNRSKERDRKSESALRLCHSPLPDWIADAGELALGVDMGAPQDSRRGILAINSNSN